MESNFNKNYNKCSKNVENKDRKQFNVRLRNKSSLSWTQPNKFYIKAKNGEKIVDEILTSFGWMRTDDKHDRHLKMIWVECKSYYNYNSGGHHLINHIENCELLCNKINLFLYLSEYERCMLSAGRTRFFRTSQFFPETYKIENLKEFEDFMKEKYNEEIWICKPANLNQGIGIRLIRTKEELLSNFNYLTKEKSLMNFPKNCKLLQRYIERPLLLEGKKFDIRAYMIIACTKPFVVLYNEGYVRLSCRQYDINDNNLETHLTNQYMQKKNPLYDEIKESTVWSMHKLSEYIYDHYEKNDRVEADWVTKNLKKRMEKICLHCFNSVQTRLKAKDGFFEIFGLDFMIDENFKIYLLEINTNPSFTINCQSLADVIPNVIKEAIEIAVECFDKTKKNKNILPIESLKNFKILYSVNSY